MRGIRVIEVGNYMAGPFCGMQLADFGADVVKVENPKGDVLTQLGCDEGEIARLVREGCVA